MRSAETGEPIHRATVVAGGRRVRTDEEGRFRLCRVSTGTGRIRVLASGYQDAPHAVRVVEGETTLDLALERDSVVHVDTRRTGAGAPALIVVDGEPVRVPDGSGCDALGDEDLPLRDLHPDEIVGIEIMKGPAAVERYGPAAAEGVILIRTRRD